MVNFSVRINLSYVVYKTERVIDMKNRLAEYLKILPEWITFDSPLLQEEFKTLQLCKLKSENNIKFTIKVEDREGYEEE